jgi:uncharacterized membrane protein YkvA (DUF1232 family)
MSCSKLNLKNKISNIKKQTAQVYIALQFKETPWYAKVLAALTIAYALSPIDLIPDFIPILGYLDDLIILPLLVYLTIKLIPAETWTHCEVEAEKIWTNGTPKKWYYALPILLVWLCALSFISWLLYTKYALN